MLSVILTALFCAIYGYNLRAEFVYVALFVVSFPLWLSFSASPLLLVALLTVQTLAVWFVVEFMIRQTPKGFGLFWQVGGLRLAIARVQ